MAKITYKGVGISAIAACVPSNISSNYEMNQLMSKEEIDKTVDSIGIKEKRFVDKGVCASDLCVKAAEKLFEDNNIDRKSIDMLLFVSQTPDYKIPGTAPIIQDKLKLSKDTGCLDLSIGCSGYIYGLSAAFSYAATDGIDRVLLLVGDTFSKIVNPSDKVNAPLYGDAGTATLIEKGDFSKSYFNLFADGSGFESILVPAGQSRIPSSKQTLADEEDKDGSIRSQNELFMNGMDVFNFSLRAVPNSINKMLSQANIFLEDVDIIVLHQANRFMTDFLIKRLRYKSGLVPYCLEKFGNTSSPSIPLTISSELSDHPIENKKVILCGFGAGLSWGTFYGEFGKCNVSEIIEY
ncbi:MAG: ketoacyl-ACP synthase III [Flavobacteriaceae bacterium]|nr:ketoacyl-ACP synthase III [Flavobacteriaceae bacterium]